MRYLQVVATLALLSLVSGVVVHAASAPGDARKDDATELRRIKTEVWPRAYREQDVAALDQLLASEFQMIDATGVVSTKGEELAWVKDNRPSYERFRFEIDRLDVFENGTAVVSGRGVIEAQSDEGSPITTTYASSNVLIKRDGRWQAIASHVSGVKRVPRP